MNDHRPCNIIPITYSPKVPVHICSDGLPFLLMLYVAIRTLMDSFHYSSFVMINITIAISTDQLAPLNVHNAHQTVVYDPSTDNNSIGRIKRSRLGKEK